MTTIAGRIGAAAAGLVPATAWAATDPLVGVSGLSYMTAFGPKQYPVLTLLYALIALMLLVVVIIAVLVALGMFWRRAPSNHPAAVPIERAGRGLLLIYYGCAVTAPLLLGIAAWTYSVIAGISSPPPDPVATIRVTGHQWWWEFRYTGSSPDREFSTANELHIPAGKPVRIELETADVIHSFWVPPLSGKMDTIAGQKNVTWLQADTPGTYRGQCTEYCGLQHAHMGLLVIADEPEAFERWWDNQLKGPDLPLTEPLRREVVAGEAAFIQNCGVCHAVRGTSAGGRIGPDLSHLMERQTIAAVTLTQTTGNLSGWISDPQHVKPGNYMPTLDLSAVQLSRIRTFLSALK